MVVRISDKTQNYSKVTKLLVKPKSISGFLEYYTQLEKKYVNQGLNRHMDVNDAYVYIIAHAYKHFIFMNNVKF